MEKQKLMIVGPYRYTRNPMVFGMLSIYIALAIIINSLSCVFMLVLMLPILVVYLKLTEEKRLTRDFGNEYLQYKKKTAMLVPFFRINP